MSSDPYSVVGLWTLARRLVDRRTGQHGVVTGTLRITPELHWLERGELALGGRSSRVPPISVSRFPVTRELLITAEQDGWLVRFEDGRPFHPWRPGVVVEHPCRADVYRGLIDVREDRLRTLWDVTGPAKDQRIVTRCVRSSAPPDPHVEKAFQHRR